ncbi:hypothetical protein ACRYCC_23705 [Actinomadura scrupuli]|uniref:hypothetical protein n=1 Tax=Actinomadura scrupuli TaxID=559629 RepID=UPI003D97956D
MEEHGTDARPWSPSTACPVGREQQTWIETWMHWCAGQFGGPAELGEIALPTPDFFPASYTGTPAQIEELTARVCGLMSVDPAGLVVELFDGAAKDSPSTTSGRRAVGHYSRRDGRAVIGLDRDQASDPAYLTAIIAHELGHVRLLGENRIDRHDDHERLTDLVTVYLGLGVFTTNAAMSYAKTARSWSVRPLGYLDERTLNGADNDGYFELGYLTEREFGYALACYCRMRGETAPAWTSHLDPGPRAFLRQGLAFLARSGSGTGLPTVKPMRRQGVLRTAHGDVPIKVSAAGPSRPADLFFEPTLRRRPAASGPALESAPKSTDP